MQRHDGRVSAAQQTEIAYPVQRNTTTNCSGGPTPWGTWINGEEIVDGYMFECSPLRDGGTPIRLDRFGRHARSCAERSRSIMPTTASSRTSYPTTRIRGSRTSADPASPVRWRRACPPPCVWPVAIRITGEATDSGLEIFTREEKII